MNDGEYEYLLIENPDNLKVISDFNNAWKSPVRVTPEAQCR